ncbi:hypothetical protein LCGC14_2559380, partial [marine sediment metagenome]
MAETDISSAKITDMTNVVTDFSVDAQSTEGPSDDKETTWMNTKFTQYFGYYKTIPELQTAIDTKATWTVGKGFTADPGTVMLLDTIKGWGKDTFNTILENMIRTYHIGGDAYCEIILDDDGILINLKPLDPAVMEHVTDGKGRIIKFIQKSKLAGKQKEITFQPEDIFYLARNRVADEIHGTSVISAIEQIILMRNEAMTDYKQVMHRFVKPRWVIHVDHDDLTKIEEIKKKMDKANELGENIVVPKGTVVPELMAV